MNKREYILEGLCCPNCAAKIEDEVRGLSGVNEAGINLMTNRLSVSTTENVIDITQRIKRIVASHEPSVKVRVLSEKKEKEGHEAESEEEEKDNELRSYLFRLVLSLALTALFYFLKVSEPVRVGGFLIAYILVGYEIVIAAAKNILKGQVFDENFLMGIASLGAFIIGDHVEAITVLVFYGIGELLQDMAVNKSKKNITGLMDIRPDYANKLSRGNIEMVAPEEIEVGDLILVKPGERIPLDGIVKKGHSYIDTRALTGESVPREVAEQDSVLSGSINTSGVLEVEVTKPFGESTVSKILELVQNASGKKAESEKFITKFARYYTPIVVFTALAVAVIPPVIGLGSFSQWIYRALSFLIISCPCALVISIPLSFFGGIGGAARNGILVKGGNYLDALKKLDTIVFDKTGTLTKGVFEVKKVFPADGVEPSDLVKYAAIAEIHSTHPIAKSILSYADKNNIAYTSEINSEATINGEKHLFGNEADDHAIDNAKLKITEKAGYGIIAEYKDDIIYAGNLRLMEDNLIKAEEVETAGSIVHIAINQSYLGYLLIADELKPGVKETMLSLKNMGIKRTIMLTGDHHSAAKEVAELSQVDHFEAELLPQDKVSWFEKLKQEAADNTRTAFVGDGINDAPVLAGADIGIAMGGIGSDAAIEAADVVIMNDEIGKINTAIKIARKTSSIVYQNIVFALGIKLLIMALAFFGITSIWFAIFADVGVALLALLNAMRAMRIKKSD